MEIARVTLGYTADPAWIINDPQRFPDVHSVAQALTAYGDQRAREAVEQRVLAGWGPPIGASPNEHKNALTAHGDQRAREAGLTDSQIHDFWQAIEKNKG
jgi:hypothetical protein